MNRTQMRSLFKNLIDETSASSDIFSESRINELLFQGAQQVQDFIEDNDEHFFEDDQTITAAAGTTSIALSDDTRRVKELYRANDSESPFRLTYVDTRRLPNWTAEYASANAFTVRGNTILFPVPLQVSTTFRLVVTKQIEDLASDSEQWLVLPSFARRLVVYEAAYMGLISENSDIDKFERLLSDVRTKVNRVLENRVDTGSRGVEFERE